MTRPKQTYKVHPRKAAIRRQFANILARSHLLGNVLCQLIDDVAQTMDLRLPRDVRRDAARVLDIFLPMKNIPDRLRFWSDRVPHVHGEDERVLARPVVENDFRWGIRQNTSVPIEFSVDTHGRERRRQSARRHDVLRRDLSF